MKLIFRLKVVGMKNVFVCKSWKWVKLHSSSRIFDRSYNWVCLLFFWWIIVQYTWFNLLANFQSCRPTQKRVAKGGVKNSHFKLSTLMRKRTEDIKLSDDFKDGISFSELFLSEHIEKALKEMGFQKPSPIQYKAIPIGRIGSGK